MKSPFSPALPALTAALLWVTVPASPLSAQPLPGPAMPGVNPRVAEVVRTIEAGGPAEGIVKWFADPDEQVRFAAYGGLLTLKVDDPATLMTFMEAAERETTPRVREQAYSVADGLSITANRRLARDAEFMGRLYEAFRGNDAGQRRGAILVLGAIEAKDAPALDAYAAAIKDPDLAVRLAAVRSIARLLNALQGVDEAVRRALAASLIAAFASDPTLRDRAGLALFSMAGDAWAAASAELRQAVDGLMKSKDPVDRGVAAVIRRRMDAGAAPADPTLTARLLTEAVGHPYYWVRAGATDALFRFPRTFPAEGYRVLFDAIGDPQPAVAADAALRLSGALPLNLPNFGWAWAERNLVVPQAPRPTVPWTGTNVQLLDSKQPGDRIKGLKEIQQILEKLGPAQAETRAGSAMPLIVKRFDDPDLRVSAAARQAARAALKPVVAQGQRRTSTTAPTTRPFGPRRR